MTHSVWFSAIFASLCMLKLKLESQCGSGVCELNTHYHKHVQKSKS